MGVTGATIQYISLFYRITARKVAKWMKNIIYAVDGQRLAHKYDRQIQGQAYLRITFIMLK